MLKTIPSSDISQKKFKVYKEWVQTESDFPVLPAFSETGSSAFDTGSSSQTGGIYASPLWHSIKTRYYSTEGNVFTQAGVVRNPGRFNIERQLSSTAYVIQIPQLKYGEQIKKNSVVLHNLDTDIYYYDDGFGGMTTENSTYAFISYDVETQNLVLEDGVNGTEYTIVLSSFDVNTGIGIFTYGGDTDDYLVLQVDFQTGLIALSEQINLSTLEINPVKVGNVFYDDGLIVLSTATFNSYILRYRSTMEIHETEVLISVEPGEFNTSQNPTAVDVTLFQSSSFETTPITNSKPGGTVLIKEVLDIRKKETFIGTVSGSVSGSWNDYYESSSIDPTGSYLAPYITTIGLYDSNYDMVAVAKLPKPIKNLPDFPVNFIVRFDT